MRINCDNVQKVLYMGSGTGKKKTKNTLGVTRTVAPEGAEKAGRAVSKEPPSGLCWMGKRRTGAPKVALKFGVWKVGAWKDDWKKLGEGAGEDMSQACGAQSARK